MVLTLYFMDCKNYDHKKQGEKALPTHKSAEKRLKTSEKANIRNKAIKSRIMTLLKKTETSSDEASLKEAVSFLDKAARKGTIHPNKASRIKSRLTRQVQKKASSATQ
jgi:small subunit ribosomal protein S20